MDDLSEIEMALGDALLNTSFCAAKDTFFPISFPLQPLTFDRLGDGGVITSNFPVFKLPIELHSNVVRYMDRVDLANLALVDRDCRQLARSAQFAIVHLSISRASIELITHIFNESVCHNEEDSGNRRRIGPCVRRLVVGSNAMHVLDIRDNMDDGNNAKDCMRMSLDLHGVLMSFLSHCLPAAFPNLELFQFTDEFPLQLDLFQHLSKIQLRHLSFDNFGIGESQCDAQDSLGSGLALTAWSDLQTLHITLLPKWKYNLSRTDTTKVVLLEMLHTAAPSIEGLRLGRVHLLDHDFARVLPEFPRLRRLHLEECWGKEEDGSNLLRRLLPLCGTALSSLEALQLDRIDIAHLLRLGVLPHLTRLVINDYSLKARATNFAFLAANPQLELLSFTFPIKSRTLRDNLLPVIHTSGFSSLKALRLTFASTHASKRVIAAIGLISSLEMLWLSAGQQFGWQYDWFIDHSVLKKGLKGLRRLRELAFTRESYHGEMFQNEELDEVRLGYYSYPVLPSVVADTDVLSIEDDEHLQRFETSSQNQRDFQRRTYIWEKWHRERMRKLAKDYVNLFSRLEFIYIGEYPMEVVRNSRTNGRRISMLTDHRESYLTELNLKWGSQTI